MLNWIQNLAQPLLNSSVSVFAEQLDRISSRFELRLLINVTKLFKIIDFDQVNDFAASKEADLVGFASQYLLRCEKESKSDDEININIYTELVELDSKLGTSAAEQLFHCVSYTQRLELIKVWIKKELLF